MALACGMGSPFILVAYFLQKLYVPMLLGGLGIWVASFLLSNRKSE
ncbi:MAG: hypothetical protein KDA65_01085 [Planctomycetaceae bacterium]|nr:hypothetical protein [Planctomycetaceae bacterium]